MESLLRTIQKYIGCYYDQTRHPLLRIFNCILTQHWAKVFGPMSNTLNLKRALGYDLLCAWVHLIFLLLCYNF